MAADPAYRHPEAMLAERPFTRRPAEPASILLVEDDAQFAELVRAQLRRMPWVQSRLEVVATLRAALAKLEGESFGLVLCDLNLPDSKGLDTLAALCRAGDQPVIVLSGDPNPATRAGAMDSGAFDFLSKDNLSASALERLVRLAVIQANTQRLVHESEERFRRLLELSSDWYWEQDEELRFTRFEGRERERTGAEATDFIGKRRWQVAGLTPLSCTWEQHRRQLEAREPFRDFEYSRPAQDGATRYVSASGEPVYDRAGRFRGYRGLATDITARKQAEEELQRFRLAMDESADIIVLIDRKTMRFVDVNRTACRLLGYTRAELLALGPQDVLPLSREQLEKSYEEFIANPGQASSLKSYYRCKDGSQLPFESTRRALRSGSGWIIAAIARDIRERIAAEQALRQSEARFRSLTALSADWYWEQDEEFRLTFMSSIVKLGLDPSKYLGLRRWEQPALNLTEADWARHRAQLERHEPFHDFEMQRLAEDGGSVWLSLSGEPMFDEAGRFSGYGGIGRDITQRKRAEQEMAGLGRMYAALGAANEAVLRAQSADEVFARACEIAVEAGGFLLGTVFVLDRDAGGLRRAVTHGPGASTVDPRTIPLEEVQAGGQALIGHAYRSGEAVISNDYQADPRTEGSRTLMRGHEVGSAAVFPLRAAGELAGVFGLLHVRRDAFTGELTGLLQRLADNVSFALQNLRADKRRRKVKSKLTESEERFRSLTGLSSDWYWEQDENFRFTRMTNATGGKSDRSERGPVSGIGQTRWDAPALNMTESDWAAHRALLEAHLPFRDLELHRRTADGKLKYTVVSGEPVFDASGAFKGYRGVGKDITARKRAEQLRALEHAVNRSIAESDSSAAGLKAAIRAVCETEGWECGRYFRVDEKDRLLRFAEGWCVADEAAERFLAGSRNIVYRPGQGLSGLAWKSGEPLWSADVTRDARSSSGSSKAGSTGDMGMHGTLVFPVLADGKTIGVLSFASRKPREPEPLLLEAIRVIGSQIGQFLQRKHTEEVVRASEERFRSLTNLSSDVYWEQDAQLRFTTFTENRPGEPGVSKTALLGKRRWDIDYLNMTEQDWARHRAVLEAHQPFHDLELRRVEKGAEVWISTSGEPVFDGAGQFIGYRGVGKEITAAKREEMLLRLEHAVTRCLAEADTAATALIGVLQATCETQNWECGRYFSWDSKTSQLALAESWHVGTPDLERFVAESRQLRYRPGEGLIGRAYEKGEPLWVVDLATDPRLRAGLARQAGMHGAFFFCAHSGGKPLGVFAFHTRKLREPDERLLRTVGVIGSQAGQFLTRKLAEQRQAQLLRHQERIARFGQSAIARREPPELIEEAVQNVLEGLAAESVAYFERGTSEGALVLRSLVGARDPAAAAAPGAEGPVLAVLDSGQRRVIDGGQLGLSWTKGLGSVALVPVRGEREVRGVLCVGYAHADAFSAESFNFIEAAASVLSAGLQRIDSEGRLAYLAQFDPLTGLPNRALLADRFSQMIVQATRHDSLLAVLFIDLDEFKAVNDTLGHAGGDDLLKETAVRLQSCVRSGDTVARISGDEFAVVLADLAKLEDAALVAQKIIDRVGAACEIHGHEVFVTASVGIAAFPGDGADAETLIGAADAAMYRAKQSGRNSYQFFTSEINQRSRARAQLGTELRRALERGEFALAYQPKYRLTDRKQQGAEALLRWKHPERGIVSPMEFIPVLEETGLIVPVGEWVLARACEDLKAWAAAGLDAGPVAVNLSARQFRQQDLDARLKAVIAKSGVSPTLIEMEITESQLMQDPDHAIEVMRSLADAGIKIVIDDFGTGYSSLSYLTRFPVGTLKIDRSFVAKANQDPNSATIVRTIIEMAHSLGFTVVAEGVETEEQATFLRLLRCEQAQGYLFARPAFDSEFRKLIQKAN